MKASALSIVITLLVFSCSLDPGSFPDNLEKAERKAKHENLAPLILFDFEEGFDLESVECQLSTVSLKEEGGNTKLHVECSPRYQSASIRINHPDGWDLNPWFTVKMDITNTCDRDIQVIMQVGDPEDSFEGWQMQEVVDLKPGETKTVSDPMAVTPWRFLDPMPMVGMFGPPGMAKTDLENINVIRIATRYANLDLNFEIDNIRAEQTMAWVDTTGFFPFVDEFGQYMHSDWPGKVHSMEDLIVQKEEEALDLAANPEPPGRNKFGGWTDGPQLEATGYFRAEKYAGSWWLVDPEGRLFWSNGVNCVHSGSGTTGISGRERYFDALPEHDGACGEFYGRRRGGSRNFYLEFGPHTTFDFSSSNMRKKYGEQWQSDYLDIAHARIRSWGMNTLANASSRELYMQSKTPYVATVWVRGTEKIEASSGYQGKFHDVFHPSFRQALKRSLSYQTSEAGDPWCLGFFIENELSWGRDRSLALATLASGPQQVAKMVFLDDLRTKYGSIGQLNDAWGTGHESWEAMLESREQPAEENAKDDLDAFYQKIATTYFKTVREEMKAVAPHILYLGCRLAWANSDIVVRTAAKYCDVISYNKYEYSVSNVGLPEGVDKPIMIGEYHFGALDRGLFHVGIKSASDQVDRGRKFQVYVESALTNPYIVGAHWFQYMDQCVTGRGDGENYNVGLVSIADRPHPEMVAAMRETGNQLYEIRLNRLKQN